MTESFIEFYQSNKENCRVFNDCSPAVEEQVLSWLSAFVREVEQRARDNADPFGHGFKTELRILGVALEEVVRDFGLEEER